ncbi:hypothetical protein CVD25_22200 [Bacillus canaveralius]|uniref:Uncharacterized protein n=1 Tax=Bacillus canaveralius TaxID=1403243 RepID=A0A2N5GP75_9BACI|nr:hypothetical protein CU635_06350 [Bacillus canaveralius]PLR88811.1 hypothetical protein CVD25_22200 [Bacillus canaveralius]
MNDSFPQREHNRDHCCRGRKFYRYCFEKAEGQFVTDLEANPDVVQNWGRTMGKMHALAKTYQPLDPAIRHL